MKIGKYSPERLLKEIVKLDPVEFMGICKILGIKIYDFNTELQDVEENDEGGDPKVRVGVNPEPRDFTEIWSDMCDKIDTLNRTQRRNLGAIVYAATKKEK